MMSIPYKLIEHTCRKSEFFAADDARVPAALFTAASEKVDLSSFPLPLPCKKSTYTCKASTSDGALWLGADGGVTRYDENAARPEDKVQFFSAVRDLPDNNVKNLYAEGDALWVLTDSGVTRIIMPLVGAEEKAEILLAETLAYVDRRGMISQKKLAVPGDVTSAVSYGHSDNDGCFTAGFAIAEMFHYATLKREKGAEHPDTIRVRAIATRAVEACLLLMHIHGRGDGFVARSYLCHDEPVPDDGLFFAKKGGKATCLDTRHSRKRGMTGLVIDASAPVPERLARLYTELGYSDDDIIYKADTSSDEITLHFLHMYFAHEILGEGDAELDSLIKQSVSGLMAHIIDHGYELHDCTGEPTTWAKWSESYFESDFGWVDACLNSAELLLYHLVTMRITGEQGRWRESYESLIARGYADLPAKHYDRLLQAGISMNFEPVEDIMFGDHMLAVSAFWGLCTIETDEELLKKYRAGFASWRTTIAREHNPGYDLPYALSCPDEEIDIERLASWFYRTNLSRLAAGVSLMGRHDVPVITRLTGHKEISYLPSPDELFISKYDRNPYAYKNEDSGGLNCVESCYVYTFAYWIGRYYGFFK